MTSTSTITLDDVYAARERIAPYAHRTPVLTCSAIDEMAGRKVFFKCENFQKVGAFKFRGACNAVFSLGDDEAGRGVVTHSSGNHAQALALAAQLRGVAAHIVMPSNAPGVKRRAVEGYGARVYECEPTLQAREGTTAEVLERTGGTLIHPYNDPRIIAGQGTCALELLEQVEPSPPAPLPGGEGSLGPSPRIPLGGEGDVLDAVIAPIGGGGLMSGTCISVGGFCLSPARQGKGIRIIGAEPTGADDAARSLAAGRLIPQANPDTIADGLLTSLGSLTWPIIRDHVERIVTVSDDQIIKAMRLIWERMKIIVEPSSATVLAVVLSDEFRALDGIDRVGLILSGGNVDLDRLPWTDAGAVV